MDDPRVTESSGLALSRRHPHTVWTVNDSGDDARVVAVDTRTGKVTGVHRYSTAQPRDTEAVTTGPDGLYVGDIGDNFRLRRTIEVSVFPEPPLGETSGDARTYRLRYPDGAHDAETLMVLADRTLVVVTKGSEGAVYLATAPGEGRTATLRRVADAPPGRTDGVLLPGGHEAVVRGYLDAAVLRTSDWQVRSTFSTPLQPQGEGVGLDGHGHLLLSSEGRPWDLLTVPVPRVTPAPAGATSTTGSAPATSGTGGGTGRHRDRPFWEGWPFAGQIEGLLAVTPPWAPPVALVLAVGAAVLVSRVRSRRRRGTVAE